MYTWAIIEHGSDQESEASEAFDRWLAAHDAELERQCTAWVKSATEAKDAERAMRAERDALRAQLDGMTTEWGIAVRSAESSAIVTYFERDRAACERFIANQPLWHTHREGESFAIVSRVGPGPWVEVAD